MNPEMSDADWDQAERVAFAWWVIWKEREEQEARWERFVDNAMEGYLEWRASLFRSSES